MSNIDYTTLSLEELYNLKKEYSDKVKLYDTKQMAAKISLNSAYGACGNRFFKYYSLENASAITITGQIIIQTAKNTTNQYLNSILKTSDEQYVLYADTDSVVGSSVINVNGSNITIAEYFDLQDSYIKKDDFNKDYVKSVNYTATTPSLNKSTGEVEYKQIKYVMKHKVNKRMFRISYKDNEVIVTEDHSIIVNRKGKYLDVKPKDLKSIDKIIII